MPKCAICEDRKDTDSPSAFWWSFLRIFVCAQTQISKVHTGRKIWFLHPQTPPDCKHWPDQMLLKHPSACVLKTHLETLSNQDSPVCRFHGFGLFLKVTIWKIRVAWIQNCVEPRCSCDQCHRPWWWGARRTNASWNISPAPMWRIYLSKPRGQAFLLLYKRLWVSTGFPCATVMALEINCRFPSCKELARTSWKMNYLGANNWLRHVYCPALW